MQTFTAIGIIPPYKKVSGAKHPDRKEREKPIRQEDTKMKTNELNVNMMEKVSGGNFFADLEEVLRNIFQDPAKREKQIDPKKQDDVTARGKC